MMKYLKMAWKFLNEAEDNNPWMLGVLIVIFLALAIGCMAPAFGPQVMPVHPTHMDFGE